MIWLNYTILFQFPQINLSQSIWWKLWDIKKESSFSSNALKFEVKTIIFKFEFLFFKDENFFLNCLCFKAHPDGSMIILWFLFRDKDDCRRPLLCICVYFNATYCEVNPDISAHLYPSKQFRCMHIFNEECMDEYACTYSVCSEISAASIFKALRLVRNFLIMVTIVLVNAWNFSL